VSTLLPEVRDWGNSYTTAQPFDVASFWTRRDLQFEGSSSTAGFAYTGTVCETSRYNINEESDAIANSRNIQTHELGHNFGASHDSSGGFIMSPSGGLTWSQTSIDVINAYYSGEDGECLCQSGLGCADKFAHNYNPDAQANDGSCETCTDGIQNGPETGIDVGPTCLVDLSYGGCQITGDLSRKIFLGNDGNIVSTTPSKVGLYLSADQNITTSDYLIGTANFFSVDLNPNSFGLINVFGNLNSVSPPIPPGTYYIGTILDYQNLIPEWDEDNNVGCTGQTYTIGGTPGCTDPLACNYDSSATEDPAPSTTKKQYSHATVRYAYRVQEQSQMRMATAYVMRMMFVRISTTL